MPQSLATAAEAEFLVLLPSDRIASQRERLAEHLGRRFHQCSFRVQADMSDLCGERGYWVVPIIPTRPVPQGRYGAMIMGR